MMQGEHGVSSGVIVAQGVSDNFASGQHRTQNVSARLDRAIQYSREAVIESRARRTGYPLEPAVGLGEGETRWRV
jgi:hypothetical protein